MSKEINGAVEFVSTRGERGGIDTQITDWIEANPDATIIDVKYRVAVYQDGGKTKLAKLALVLYHREKAEDTPKAEARTASKDKAKDKPGARTMVMNLRKDLYDDRD